MTTQKKAYFNLHTEGLAYLNALDFITPKKGGKQFLSLAATLLEGDPEQPNKTYVSLVVPDALNEVVDVLVKQRDAIANRDIIVFANLKFANLRHKPFVYGENSKTPGELGVNLSATLISLNYLKVGDQVVYLGESALEDTSNSNDKAVAPTPVPAAPVAATVQSAPRQTTQAPELSLIQDLPTVGNELFSYPLTCKLSKDDSQFEARKEALKGAGYRFNGDTMVWMKPEVELAKDDPAFEQKKALLKELSYQFNGNSKTWRVTFSRRQYRRQG